MRQRIIFYLYRALLTAALPVLAAYVGWRVLRDRHYGRHLSERLGRLPHPFKRTLPDSIWLHAVSVGEVLSSLELISQIRARLPDSPVFLSCSTSAGREAAEAKMSSIVDGVFYAPFDFVWAVRRVLRTIRPVVVVILETEIWPNLYHEVKRSGAGLIVVNGRISRRTASTYYKHRWFFQHVLSLPDKILAQSASDAEHYLRAGAPAEVIVNAGNLKYDFQVPKPVAPLFRAGPVWICASTVAPEYAGDVDEDDAVLSAYQSLLVRYPNLKLIIAPRRPERFEVVASKLAAEGVAFVRRSQHDGLAAGVVLLDSIGELAAIFKQADLVFMGGTLADRGGHNVLEPAALGKPIIAGPHLENFAEIEKRFTDARALYRISGPADLASAIERLLNDKQLARELGERAQATADAHKGATERAVTRIVDLRWRVLPRAVPNPALCLLSELWKLGSTWKRRADLRKAKSLSAPVISVGGISLGGVGKTPFVAYLSRMLLNQGHSVAILTRGYKRRSNNPVAIVRPGEMPSVDETGDEAQILLRTGAALGIGADRSRSGAAIEGLIKPDIFLLDDGFQHARLKRSLDIVLIDALDPFGGGAVFPSGRLREPMTALRRADILVISRAEDQRTDAIVREIRLHNSSCPILTSTVVPIAWRRLGHDEKLAPSTFARTHALAFCGLANPAAFWKTLSQLDIDVTSTIAFPDHHRYTPSDVDRLRSGRRSDEVLLTTEKDAVNLQHLIPVPLPIYWLEVDVQVQDRAVLESAVGALLRPLSQRADL